MPENIDFKPIDVEQEKKETPSGENVYSDEPITTEDDDILGCKNEVKRMAASISKRFDTNPNNANDNNTTYTYGIFGKWGIGKTSFVNLVKEKLIKENSSRKINFAFFVPSSSSDESGIYHQFFEKLSQDMELGDRQKRCNKFFWGIPIIILVVVLCYLAEIPILANLAWIVSVLFTIVMMMVFYKKYALNPIEYFISFVPGIPPSFVNNVHSRSLKEAIIKLLNKNPTIVAIDDIDRMNEKDTQALFNFLLNARDIKNLVFILVFDKEIVLKSLGQEKDSKYLEKFFVDTIDLEIVWKDQVRQLINKKLHHDCAEISYYLSRYITNLRELKAIINKISESDYWNACHLDRNSIIILECLRYINIDIYKIIQDNSEPTFEEKKLPDALSKLHETNPVKQYLYDTNIIHTKPMDRERAHQHPHPSLKYYFEDHEEDTMVTREDLGLLIEKENNTAEFQKGFNALIEKGKNQYAQSDRLNNLIMGKQLLLANQVKSSSTEPFPSVDNLPETWLLAIANLDESHVIIYIGIYENTNYISW